MARVKSYDNLVKPDKQAQEIKEKNIRLLKVMYEKDPDRIKHVAMNYKMSIIRCVKHGYSIDAFATWQIAQNAYSEVTFDFTMFDTLTERITKKKKKPKHEIQPWQLFAVQEYGNTIIKATVLDDFIVEEFKRSLNLDVKTRPMNTEKHKQHKVIELV